VKEFVVAETRARDTADINVTVDALPTFAEAAALTNRNLVYNGAMQVAQRSASVTGITGNGYYTADRWQTLAVSLGTWTQSIESDAPTGSGFSNSLKMLCTTASASPDAGGQIAVQQPLEGQDLQRIAKGTASAQQLTVSFWVKSNVTGNYVFRLQDVNNTRSVSALYAINASATWEYKVITVPADTTGALTNNNNLSMRVTFWLGAGSDRTSGTLDSVWTSTVTANVAAGQTNLAAATDNYWQITGVQLEVGDTATEFEFKSYGQELRECQRYYYRIQPGATTRVFSAGQATSTAGAVIVNNFPVTMRTRPTAIEQTGTAANYSLLKADGSLQACNAVPSYSGSTSENVFAVGAAVAANIVAGNATVLYTSDAGAYLAWSAEL
jgi:phage gp37-like protein